MLKKVFPKGRCTERAQLSLKFIYRRKFYNTVLFPLFHFNRVIYCLKLPTTFKDLVFHGTVTRAINIYWLYLFIFFFNFFFVSVRSRRQANSKKNFDFLRLFCVRHSVIRIHVKRLKIGTYFIDDITNNSFGIVFLMSELKL